VTEERQRQIAQLVGKDKRKQFDDEAVVNHHGAITHTYDVDDRPPAAVAHRKMIIISYSASWVFFLLAY
jgi:hypothetical protein